MNDTVTLDGAGRIAQLKSLAAPLTRSDIYEAVNKFIAQKQSVNSYSHSTTYDLIVGGKSYPPKAIFGLAISSLLGVTVRSEHFSAGVGSPCFVTLESLGFEINPKIEQEYKSSNNSEPKAKNKLWSEEELSEAVDCYLEMFHKDQEGTKYKKSHYYNYLASKYDRTPKAFGRRMSNITHIMMLMDLPTVAGLAPLSNVGKTQAPIIERLIAEKLNQPFIDVASIDAEAQSVINSKSTPPKPKGEENPSHTETTTKVYKRSGKVKGWVIRRANGFCELCDDKAPFEKDDSTPFLEVHHLTRLKDGGPDTVGNCAALCPNCHRKLHYSAERFTLTKTLREHITKIESGL